MNPTFTSFDTDKIDFEILFDNFIEFKDAYMLLSLINDFESGTWRTKKFTNFIFDHIAETALTYKEREALNEGASSILSRSIERMIMVKENKENKGYGGELGEAFLYGILKKYYNAFPINPKIFYKQNRYDNAKGADSVHITQDDEGKFHLWFGESKFYTQLSNAIPKAIESVKDLFEDEKLRKEKSLITNLDELQQYATKNHLKDNEEYKKLEKILRYETSLDELKKILHIPISIIYECEITQKTQEISDKYKQEMETFHYQQAKEIQTKLDQELSSIFGIEKVKFHIILFPIPNKSDILEKLKASMEVFS